MKKRTIGLIVGIGLAIVAIVIINVQIQERDEIIRRMMVEGELTEVVVSTNDIPQGSTISRGNITLVRVPTRELQSGVVKDPGSVVGKVASKDILRNQYIYSSMIQLERSVEERQRQEVGLAQRIRGTRRAFTISIDNIAAVGGEVKPGDRVDVIGDMQIPSMGPDGKQRAERIVLTIFENIQVLNVGRSRDAATSVTLSLNSEEVNILNYSLNMGTIKLVLRSPTHVSEEGIAMRPFGFQNFMQKIHQKMGIQPIQPEFDELEEKMPPAVDIEIYRGGE